MSQSVPPLVVVLLCVLGAGALVTAFAAFGKSMFGNNEQPQTDFNQRSPQQDSYLRRVREINQVAVWGQARAQKREDRRQREREASDIEIQSGRSNSNVGGHGAYMHHGNGHQGHGYTHGTPTYYENDYQSQGSPNAGYEEQYYQQHQPPERAYVGGRGSPYAMHQPKAGMAETYREVTR